MNRSQLIQRHMSLLEERRADGSTHVFQVGGVVARVATPRRKCTITDIYQYHNKSTWIEAVDDKDGQVYALESRYWRNMMENDMAKTVQELDPELVATWDEDVDDFLSAVATGYLDKHLREIAATAIERHKYLTGKGLVKEVAKSEVVTTPVVATAPGDLLPVASVPCTNKVWYEGNKVDGRKVPDSNGRIRYFSKQSFVGKDIRIQPGILDDPQYDGLRVRISGMGPKMAKIDFVDPPPAGSNYDKKQKAKQPCFVTYKIVLPYLDIN